LLRNSLAKMSELQGIFATGFQPVAHFGVANSDSRMWRSLPSH
jgi:hypothetical protein